MPRNTPRTRRTTSRRRAAPAPSAAAPKLDTSKVDTSRPALCHEVDGLVYRLDASPRRNGRNIVAVHLAGQDRGAPLQDRVDLFAFRSRRGFAQVVADTFARRVDEVMGHLALVLDEAERAQAGAPLPPEVLTPERRATALSLLKRPDLLDRAAQAMEALGHVGEEQVKRLAYLIATSRLLPRPLNALLVAPSGTGKSAVLDAITALMPPEQVVSVARLTPHSLFYMGSDALRHRLVLVDEYQGQAEADHAIRVLQSRGELTLTATVKGKAESFTVRGPVAVMSGTVQHDLDAQNTTRCIELPLDDSPQQTKRVQAAQAAAWSGKRPKVDSKVWCDAQRLLETRDVVVPYAPKLRFPARTSADRRSSAKLLGLIAASALLHQHQRQRDEQGRIVAVPRDYEIVHGLLAPLTAQTTEGLSARATGTHRVLTTAPRPLTRREVATALAVTYNTAKAALAELLDQELVVVADRGPPARYRVLDRLGVVPVTALLDPADLR